MRLPRITIGRLMLLVLLTALGLWAGLMAHEVYVDKDYHSHVYAHWLNGEPAMTFQGAASPPFWPRYGRHLLGLPWKKQPVCDLNIPGHFEEACEFEHPELRSKAVAGSPTVYPREIDAAYARMTRHWEKRHTPGWSPDALPK